MSSKHQSGLERVITELRDPVDWAFAIVGGALGAVVTFAVHSLDLGHATMTGALAALGLRRSWAAARRHGELIRRAANLSEVMRRNDRSPVLVEMLDYAIDKARSRAITDDAFEKEVRKIEAADARTGKALPAKADIEVEQDQE